MAAPNPTMTTTHIVNKLRHFLMHADAAHTTQVHVISQYNIRNLDGSCTQSYVLRPAERRIDDGHATDATVTIGIAETDFIALFEGHAELVQLHADGKIGVSGNVEELAAMDVNRVAVLEALNADPEHNPEHHPEHNLE